MTKNEAASVAQGLTRFAPSSKHEDGMMPMSDGDYVLFADVLAQAAPPAAPVQGDALRDALTKLNNGLENCIFNAQERNDAYDVGYLTEMAKTLQNARALLAAPAAATTHVLKEHQITTLVSDLASVARNYFDKQSLRENIRRVVLDALAASAAPASEAAMGAGVPADVAERAEHALAHARHWISSAPHSENCFLVDPWQCVCGKDAALDAIDRVDLDAPSASAQQDEREAGLLRCPLCGFRAELRQNELFPDRVDMANCVSCGCSAHVSKWNNRAAQQVAGAVDAERIAREAVEQFKAALYRVPGFGNRVNKEVREKLAEAHCIMLNLPALLDRAALSREQSQGRDREGGVS